MKRGVTFLAFILSCLIASTAENPQPPKAKDFSARFVEANRLMEEKLWYQAIKEWQSLLSQDPDNANVNYKLGYSYLQTAMSKPQALQYLEVATQKKVSKSYDPFDPTERRAPVDALFYLGKAQHLNYQLDPAIETYNKLLKMLNQKHVLYQRAQREIEMCEEAKRQVANPKQYVITNVGPVINSSANDFSPVLSIDESSMFFTSRRLRPDSTNSQIVDPETNEYKEDIYVSFRDELNQWTNPELLNLNSDEHDATISVSPDGLTLFIYRDSLGDGRILYSKLIGEIWSDPAKLGSDINTKYWETHCKISADGNTLYFTSNRPGGLGGRDIYRCVKLPNGEWSKALSAGPVLNTIYEEDSPFLSPDGRTIYFASQGHTSMGGFDLFYSKLGDDGEWSKPENMGFPLNTVDDDVFFQPMADGRRAYYSSQKDGGYGLKDIYLVDMPMSNESQVAVLKGFIIGEEGKELPPDLKVVITNLKTGEKTEYRPRMRDGGYLAILAPCTNYHIDYYQGQETIKQDDIIVPCEGSFQELEREVYLIPVKIEKEPEPPIVVPVVEIPKPIPPVVSKEKEDLGYDPKDPIKTQFIEELGYAEFSRYFIYDSKDFGAREVKFQQFINDVKKIIQKRGRVTINVESSASKVPSSKFKNNEELTAFRNKTAQEMVTTELEKLGFKKDLQFVFG
ncbi:MAG: PD40 domain-containing protein, partial [Crocinitomicaceae bacterium]|nr:PD40 domain-containing protein [Crocinitomicaceae bacterium]